LPYSALLLIFWDLVTTEAQRLTGKGEGVDGLVHGNSPRSEKTLTPIFRQRPTPHGFRSGKKIKNRSLSTSSEVYLFCLHIRKNSTRAKSCQGKHASQAHFMPENACQPEYVLDSRAAIGTKSYLADRDKTRRRMPDLLLISDASRMMDL